MARGPWFPVLMLVAVMVASTPVAVVRARGEDAEASAEPPTRIGPAEVISLWPGDPPEFRPDVPDEAVVNERVRNISYPALEVFTPTPGAAESGADPRPAVLIFPGGGFGYLTIEKEGRAVARRFAESGIVAAVVRYRVAPYRAPVPWLDGARAVRVLRHEAARFRVDPRRVGVLGFSAGGHVAASVSVDHDPGHGTRGDPVEARSSRPDFTILAYPVVSMRDGVTHGGSRTHLLGATPSSEAVARWSVEARVDARTPPALLVHCADDGVAIANSELYAQALGAHGVPCTFLRFQTGGHGFGLGLGKPGVEHWSDEAIRFMLHPPVDTDLPRDQETRMPYHRLLSAALLGLLTSAGPSATLAQEVHGDVEWANGGNASAGKAADPVPLAEPEPPAPAAKYHGAIPVELRRTDAGWELLRGGQPYFIKGAGAKPGELKLLKDAGGNSIRTWGAKDLEPLLDEAHELGISVCVGIWLGHEKHGFDYSDAAQKKEQFDEAIGFVRRYKDHPAVLMWGIGNEMEIDSRGRNEKIFQHVNDIARAVKRIDPDHPTITVTAGTGGKRLANFKRWCPDVDIYGPNLYGEDITQITQRLADAGIDKPYVIPEFGPPGQWGNNSNAWSAPMELSTTDKAHYYLRHYAKPITRQQGRCLGGYVFYFKYDRFSRDWPSWYSMHHHSGEAYGGVDAMTYAWTGRWPDNLAPEIQLLDSDADDRFVNPGETYTAHALFYDRDNDPLTAEWVLARDHEAGEKFVTVPAESFILDQRDGGRVLRFRIPQTEPGAFRLHLVIKDGRGKAARANLRLFINPAGPEPVSAAAAETP